MGRTIITIIFFLVLILTYFFTVITKKKRAKSEISTETAKKRYFIALAIMAGVFIINMIVVYTGTH